MCVMTAHTRLIPFASLALRSISFVTRRPINRIRIGNSALTSSLPIYIIIILISQKIQTADSTLTLKSSSFVITHLASERARVNL